MLTRTRSDGPVVRNYNHQVHALLQKWHSARGGGLLASPEYHPIDPLWLMWCADQHDAAVHIPRAWDTIATYEVFKRENLEQFVLFREAGYKIDLWPGLGEPYPNSNAMLHDVRDSRHLWVYRTAEDDLPGHHPLAVTPISGSLENAVFRGVHNLSSHAWGGFPFSARGEESACRAHLTLYSAAAHPALVAETRMQNFGRRRRTPDGMGIPRGMTYVPLEYAPQKAYGPAYGAMAYEQWKANVHDREELHV